MLLYLDIIYIRTGRIIWTFKFQISNDYHLNSIYIYYCCFWLFVVCCHYVCHMCVLKIYVHSHEIVHHILKTCFIEELHLDKSSCLTCNVHNSTLEYSIIKRYTNAVYYYYIKHCCHICTIIYHFTSSNTAALFTRSRM